MTASGSSIQCSAAFENTPSNSQWKSSCAASATRASSRRGDLLGALVDRHDGGAGRGQLQGQGAVAAAKIEDALADAGRQEIEHRFAQHRDEAGIALVARRIPMLGWPRAFAARHRTTAAALPWR
jgi:hypothetical protein